MKCITKRIHDIRRTIVQLVLVRLQVLVVLSMLSLALLSRMPDSAAGWITCPPRVLMVSAEGRRRRRRRRGGRDGSRGGRRAGWL